MERFAATAGHQSRAVERARFLVGASALIILAHAVDVFHAHGANWAALGVRGLWALLLLVHARYLTLPGSSIYRVTRPLAALGTAVLFLALLAVTGGYRSPLYSFTFVLVIVLPVIASEFLATGIAASVLLEVGAATMLIQSGPPVEAVIGWAHLGVLALPVAWLLGYATLRAERRIEDLTIASEEALARVVAGERMAAVGRLAAEVAHHVNNPLAAARTTAAFLQEELGQGGRERAAWDDLFSALDRIAALTRQLQRDTAPDDRPTTP